jgi:hypothetical protein
MRIAPAPILLASGWAFLTQHIRQLFSPYRRSQVRMINAAPIHFDQLQEQLHAHGIVTEVRSSTLVAHLRHEREQSDLFLIEFAEFMVHAPVVMQSQWLEFCLELHS